MDGDTNVPPVELTVWGDTIRLRGQYIVPTYWDTWMLTSTSPESAWPCKLILFTSETITLSLAIEIHQLEYEYLPGWPIHVSRYHPPSRPVFRIYPLRYTSAYINISRISVTTWADTIHFKGHLFTSSQRDATINLPPSLRSTCQHELISSTFEASIPRLPIEIHTLEYQCLLGRPLNVSWYYPPSTLKWYNAPLRYTYPNIDISMVDISTCAGTIHFGEQSSQVFQWDAQNPLRDKNEGGCISPGLEVIPESSAMKERACPLRCMNDRGCISLRFVVVSETLAAREGGYPLRCVLR